MYIVCIHNLLFGGNQTDGNSFERFLTPYQYSRLPLKTDCTQCTVFIAQDIESLNKGSFCLQ